MIGLGVREFLGIGFVFEKQLLAIGGWLLALFCISVSPCAGAVYVRLPLMHEAACLVRKMVVFGVGDCCKLLWGRGLENFGFLCFSRIVQTGFMRNSAERRSLCLFDMIRLRRG